MSDKIEAFSACCYDTRVDPSKDLIGNAIQEIKREYLFAIKTKGNVCRIWFHFKANSGLMR